MNVKYEFIDYDKASNAIVNYKSNFTKAEWPTFKIHHIDLSIDGEDMTFWLELVEEK